MASKDAAGVNIGHCPGMTSPVVCCSKTVISIGGMGTLSAACCVSLLLQLNVPLLACLTATHTRMMMVGALKPNKTIPTMQPSGRRAPHTST